MKFNTAAIFVIFISLFCVEAWAGVALSKQKSISSTTTTTTSDLDNGTTNSNIAKKKESSTAECSTNVISSSSREGSLTTTANKLVAIVDVKNCLRQLPLALPSCAGSSPTADGDDETTTEEHNKIVVHETTKQQQENVAEHNLTHSFLRNCFPVAQSVNPNFADLVDTKKNSPYLKTSFPAAGAKPTNLINKRGRQIKPLKIIPSNAPWAVERKVPSPSVPSSSVPSSSAKSLSKPSSSVRPMPVSSSSAKSLSMPSSSVRSPSVPSSSVQSQSVPSLSVRSLPMPSSSMPSTSTHGKKYMNHSEQNTGPRNAIFSSTSYKSPTGTKMLTQSGIHWHDESKKGKKPIGSFLEENSKPTWNTTTSRDLKKGIMMFHRRTNSCKNINDLLAQNQYKNSADPLHSAPIGGTSSQNAALISTATVDKNGIGIRRRHSLEDLLNARRKSEADSEFMDTLWEPMNDGIFRF